MISDTHSETNIQENSYQAESSHNFLKQNEGNVPSGNLLHSY